MSQKQPPKPIRHSLHAGELGNPLSCMLLLGGDCFCFLPLLLLMLPLFLSLDGILYPWPVADGLAAIAAVLMIRVEFVKLQCKI